LVAAEAGVKRISEFFLADTVLTDTKGREARLIEMLDGTTGNWRRMLTAGSPAEGE
jgi:hypothetical protein